LLNQKNSTMIKILIAEDISRLAKALKDKIELVETFKVSKLVQNGKEAIDYLNKGNQVDVIFMDINMPLLNGIEATKLISNRFPHIKIIMSTVFDDEEHIFQAILAGAQGYILKDERPAEIHHYLEELLAGGAPMSTEIAGKALKLIKNGRSTSKASVDYGLTAREKEILSHLSTGITYEQIAGNLNISKGTVRKHVENIYKKLQVNSRMEALKKAL